MKIGIYACTGNLLKKKKFAERSLVYALYSTCAIIRCSNLNMQLQNMEIFDKWQNLFFFFSLPNQNFVMEMPSCP